MALPTLPRSLNRLTAADVASIQGEVTSAMRAYPAGYQPSVGADFNSLMHLAITTVFANPWEPTEAELDQMYDLVLAKIQCAVAQ